MPTDPSVPTATLRGEPGVPATPAASEPPDGVTVQPLYPLYDHVQIGLATFVGGPFAGAWLMRRNWVRLRQERAARITLIVGVLATLATFGLAFALPDWFPTPALPIGYVVLAVQLTRVYQDQPYAHHIARGGARASTWKAVGAGFVSLALCAGVLVAVFVATLPPKVEVGGGHEVYYRDGAREAEARAVGQALTELGYFAPGRAATVAVQRDSGRPVVTFVVQDSVFDDREMQEAFREVGKMISTSAFGGQPIDVWLNDESDETRVRLRWTSGP